MGRRLAGVSREVTVRAVLRAIAMIVLAAVAASPALALSLRDRFSETARLVGLEGGGAFDALGDAIADTAARNLPIVSSSAGFTYRYNPQLEVFERTSDTLGPLFLERPDTLGQGKFNINVSYQYVNLNQIVGLSLTYGLLDDLDVNILVPLIRTEFDVAATTQQLFISDTTLTFNPAPGPVVSSDSSATKYGVGDILLRAKYQLPRSAWYRSAVGLQLRLPSGDKDNFQGTGSFEASPFYYMSTLLWGWVEPHANVGLDLRSDDVARSQARYGLGVDGDVTQRIGLALAFLGRSQFSGSASSTDTEFLHLTPSGQAPRPLLGIDFGRKDFFDLSFGGRAVIWRQVMLFVNGIY